MIKKSISVILALIISLACMTAVSVSATDSTPSGTAITSLSEITDLTADYYLSADIGSADTLNSTTVAGTFTGTLDGNGKTVYTSVPVFAQLGEGAEVKNLTTRGEISVSEKGFGDFLNGGAVAAASSGAFTLTDCTNYANIKYTISSVHANIGGFVGYAKSCGNVLTGCVNYGNLSHVSGTSKQGRVGGMIGYGNADAVSPVATTVFTDCKNYGTLTDASSISLLGGMVGHYSNAENVRFVNCSGLGDINGKSTGGGKIGGIASVLDDNYLHEFIGCTVDADLSSTKTQIGGIVADERGSAVFTDCTVKGNFAMEQPIASNLMGGIAAITQTNNSPRTFTNCVNEATLTGSHFIGGIVGKIGTGAVNMYGCENKGSITVPNTSTVAAHVGGIIGEHAPSAALYVVDCVNNADISINTSHGTNLIGGIVGRAESTVDHVFVNCTNNGDITPVTEAGGSKIGGIAGIITSSANGANTYIGCVNNGNVSAFNCIGGIVGQEKVAARLVACINNGDVTALGTIKTSVAAGLISLCTEDTLAYSCENNGTVKNTAEEANVYDLCAKGTTGFCNVENKCTDVALAGAQRSIEEQGETTFDLRMVTSVQNIDKYSQTGVLVYKFNGASKDINYLEKTTDTVYTQISASVEGVNTVHPATPVDGTYFAALTVTGIAVQGTHVFTVIPYAVDNSIMGATYGNAYTVTVIDGEIISVEEIK